MKKILIIFSALNFGLLYAGGMPPPPCIGVCAKVYIEPRIIDKFFPIFIFFAIVVLIIVAVIYLVKVIKNKSV